MELLQTVLVIVALNEALFTIANLFGLPTAVRPFTSVLVGIFVGLVIGDVLLGVAASGGAGLVSAVARAMAARVPPLGRDSRGP